jgi:hypothetical protein
MPLRSFRVALPLMVVQDRGRAAYSSALVLTTFLPR